MDCAVSYLSRRHRLLEMSITPSNITTNVDVLPETRSDIARRIGELVLEAIDVMPSEESGDTAVVVLDAERDLLPREVGLALLPITLGSAEEGEDVS